MAEQPPKLQPQHLFEKREKRDRARLQSYNKLLEQIQNKIYSTSQLPGNPSYLVYSVPPFMIGMPSFDIKDCIVYVVYQLRANGFEIKFTYPNLLYISWKSYEREYFLKKNPIVQAMTPPAPPTGKKTTKQVAVKQIQNPYTEIITVPPVRNATDYTPPNSFLDSLQRPTTKNAVNTYVNSDRAPVDLWKFM